MNPLTPEQKQDLLNRFKKRKYEKKSGQFPHTITPLSENDLDKPLNTFVDRGDNNNERTSSTPQIRELKTEYSSADYKRDELPVRDSDLDRAMEEGGNTQRPGPKGYTLPWLTALYPKL